MSNGLRNKILKNLNKDTINNALYSRQEWENSGHINTYVPVLNVLASGKINGGFPLYKTTYLPAPSTMGKSSLAYKEMSVAQKKHGMFVLLVETESRFNYEHAEKFGVDTDEDSFMVIQENNITKIRNALINVIDELSKEERKKIFIAVDSWGGLVSNTTIDMAKKDKTTKNMQSTQEKNDLAKYLCGSKCTVLVSGWVYENVGSMSSKKSVSGGSGIEFMPDCILQGVGCNKSDGTVKASTVDDDTQSQILGKLVTFYANKTSAGGKEDSKLTIRILKEGGVDVYYGFLPDALASGMIVKDGAKYRSTLDDSGKKYWEKDLYDNSEGVASSIWNPIYANVDFREFIERKYSFKYSEMLTTTVDFDGALD